MITRHLTALAALGLILGACGSDSGSGSDSGDGDAVAEDSAADTAPDVEDLEESVEGLPDADDPEAAVDSIVDGLEAVQESAGGGGATFTANGQTWEFPSVLCAFGEDQIGQPGAVFNLSAIADGLQLYASIDESGASHSLSLNDIEDFENPSVSLSVNGLVAGAVGAPAEFILLDDKQVSAEVVMLDDIAGQPIAEPARLSATCP
jgi:hypothetical protein